MRRRTLLKAALSLLSASVAPATLRGQTAPPIAPPVPRRFIDAHCHFFNAADLPVEGFVRIVALGDFDHAPAQLALLPNGFSIWKGLAAWLTDWIIQGNAPLPATELACLDDGSICPGLGTPKTDLLPKALAPGAPEPNAQEKERLRDLFMQQFGVSDQKSRTQEFTSQEERDRQAFMDFVLDEMKAAGEAEPGVSVKSLRSNKSAQRSISNWFAGFVLGGRSLLSRYFDWGSLLTSYRSAIVETYQTLYDRQGDRVILAAPALVDFSEWLKDYSAAPLEQQIELMEALSSRQTMPMHGFVPYDPLRELRRAPGDTSPFKIVKKAITEQGFIGVKLYPPMGYRPARNNDPTLTFTGYAKPGETDFGSKLDGALDELFNWCAAQHVPIMAHAANSQGAGERFGERADPQYWEDVLREYPDLRINFAHFSGFDAALKADSGPDIALFKDCWEYRIGQMAADPATPNVFADISYFSWVIGNRGGDSKTLEAMKKLFAEYFRLFDPQVRTILFGTDWSMIAQERDFESYVGNVESFFRDIGLNDEQLDNVFFSNAKRFMGLQNSSDDTLKRLTAFYSRNGKTAPSFE